MPVQTQETSHVMIPDGTKVEIDAGSGFVDLGAFNSDVVSNLTFDVNVINSSNASIIKRVGRNQKMEWSGTLINLNPTGVALLSGGMLTTETTAGSAITTSADQTISAGWTNMKSIPLVAYDPTTGVKLRFDSAPTLTSVTASTAGALAAGDDYFIQEDINSYSGYSILLNTAGTATVTTAESVVVDYASITPIASVTLYGGSSTFEFTAYAMRMTHTDDNGLVRRLNLPSVTPQSGGFQFNFKSAQSDGSEEMPLSCIADLDTSLDNGKQLFSWVVDTGAM